MKTEEKPKKKSSAGPEKSKKATIITNPEDDDSDGREVISKKIKKDHESNENSMHDSLMREEFDNEGEIDAEGEIDGESVKDEGESVDSIEQQKKEYRFNKPRSWELHQMRVANVWDFMPDMVINKWVKVRESEPVVFHRDREKRKIYKCDQPDCGKVFYDSAALKKHIQVHGEKLFVCSHEGCGKKFLDKSKLRRHQLVHTGEKPHKCAICGKLFSLDFNLRTHMRTHTGEKPYFCRFTGCNKRFTQSSNLSAHEKTHTMKEGGSKEGGSGGEGEVPEITQ